MFLIYFTIFIANICVVPYYFIDYVEFFLINAMIPLINNIYSLKNKKRILEIKIYNGLKRIDLFRNHISSSDSSDEDIQNRINEISEQLLLSNNKLLNSDTDSDMPDLISISDSDTDSDMPDLISIGDSDNNIDKQTEDKQTYDEHDDEQTEHDDEQTEHDDEQTEHDDEQTEDEQTEDEQTEDDDEQTEHDDEQTEDDNLIIVEDVE